MKQFKIAILPGDCIGPELMREALKVLRVIERRNQIKLELCDAPFGASAYFTEGHPFPEATRRLCAEADAVLKGPVGLSYEETQKIPADLQPECGAILPLRKHLDTFANIRPVFLPKALAHFSPLKPEVIGAGIDIIMIRELVGGLYFGAKESGVNSEGLRYVKETLEYNEAQIARVARVAFDIAGKRRRILHNIHKSNVLKSSILWNTVVEEVGREYPQVEIRHQLVDSAATLLCLDPGQFDVMVMENMFGDILSDQGGGILGSLGLMPSACLGPRNAYYEPSHGSAPDIAGKNIANPYSMIGSVAMMLELSLGMPEEARKVWAAIQQVFADGYTTPDLNRFGAGAKIIGTDAFGDRVVAALEAQP